MCGCHCCFFASEGNACASGLPTGVDDAMADIALVFHWAPEHMNHMPLTELIEWRERARERWELMHGARSNP
ncbi:GpE family phage tail protein [Pseudomonas sp. NPDC078700]|uniref:GpE family phage tail protein n=1 Tax=Pseudomonas sp. NPDC078700 TaxID=3364424 RepID=UPI0037CA2002